MNKTVLLTLPLLLLFQSCGGYQINIEKPYDNLSVNLHLNNNDTHVSSLYSIENGYIIESDEGIYPYSIFENNLDYIANIDGKAYVFKDGNINNKKEIKDLTFLTSFNSSGFAYAKKAGSDYYGCVDKNYNFIIEPMFDNFINFEKDKGNYLKSFKDTQIAYRGTTTYLVSGKEKSIIPDAKKVTSFDRGVFIVEKNDGTVDVIDSSGKKILSLDSYESFENIQKLNYVGQGVLVYRLNSKLYFYDYVNSKEKVSDEIEGNFSISYGNINAQGKYLYLVVDGINKDFVYNLKGDKLLEFEKCHMTVINSTCYVIYYLEERTEIYDLSNLEKKLSVDYSIISANENFIIYESKDGKYYLSDNSGKVLKESSISSFRIDNFNGNFFLETFEDGKSSIYDFNGKLIVSNKEKVQTLSTYYSFFENSRYYAYDYDNNLIFVSRNFSDDSRMVSFSDYLISYNGSFYSCYGRKIISIPDLIGNEVQTFPVNKKDIGKYVNYVSLV